MRGRVEQYRSYLGLLSYRKKPNFLTLASPNIYTVALQLPHLFPRWPYSFLWIVKHYRDESMPVLSISIKKHCLHSHTKSTMCHLKEPELACWEMRDHVDQSQVKSFITAKALKTWGFNQGQQNWPQTHKEV